VKPYLGKRKYDSTSMMVITALAVI
jgi:hypothetical protein